MDFRDTKLIKLCDADWLNMFFDAIYNKSKNDIK